MADWGLYVTAALLGLIIGSFLNVVAYRGPAMWRLVEPTDSPRGDLAAPRSYCPSCRAQIEVRHLVPVFSYLWLRGRCAACGAAISLRYPVVELLGAAAAVAAYAVYGWSGEALAVAVFLWSLIVLAAIDLETGYLPDAITLPLIALGLAANIFFGLRDPASVLIGAVAGYGVLFVTAFAYRRLRGREGLGLGDAKLLAAIGAWCGWQGLSPAVLVGAVATLAAIGVLALLGRRFDATTATPFGPGLCLGGAVAYFAGGMIT